MRVVHCRAVKFCTVLGGMLTAPRHGAVVALTIVEVMIHMSVEVFRAVKPRTRTNE